MNTYLVFLCIYRCGIDALSNLGEDFPVEVTPDTVIHFLEDTKEMLDGMSDEELISHKLMTDSNKINVSHAHVLLYLL